MVQAIVNLKENGDRVLNIVKGKYGLKNKSEAMNFVLDEFEKNSLEPELRPEYVEKIKNIEKKGKFKKFSGIDELRKEIENA
jgi:aspartate aminotransferase-like enzyme|tara:strand:+ start:202 stop:447 length:246 start_codon:yes stop_codon:yes gene_type:complete